MGGLCCAVHIEEERVPIALFQESIESTVGVITLVPTWQRTSPYIEIKELRIE